MFEVSSVFPLGGKVFILGKNSTNGDHTIVLYNTTDLIIMEGASVLNLDLMASDNLTSIEIPSSVNKVMEWSFYGCTNLQEIVVRGKSSLDEFEDATGLTTEGYLPEGVNIIFRP